MSSETATAGEPVSAIDAKTGASHASDQDDDRPHDAATAVSIDLPRGWKYKQFRIFGHKLPWYASPSVQLGMVSFVCFMCPGMFNALGGLGGGGKADPTLADNMVSFGCRCKFFFFQKIVRVLIHTRRKQNTALYATFAVVGFFGGTVINRLGVKWTLAFGGIGYGVYAISLLVSVHASVDRFNIFAGVLLGFCAALLWTAQGTIMISYPPENQKGQYFAWFWGIFNMGAVIGGLVCPS